MFDFNILNFLNNKRSNIRSYDIRCFMKIDFRFVIFCLLLLSNLILVLAMKNPSMANLSLLQLL